MEYNKSFINNIKGKAVEKVDLQKVSDLFSSAFKKQIKDENHVNIMIAGKNGTGKSTLINAIFGEDVAMTGTGLPVTQETKVFESEKQPLRIYDTKGLELNNVKEISSEIKEKILTKKKSTDSDDMIGAIWYTIAANAGRIEPAEIEFVNEIVDDNVDVPVIIVLTKSDNPDEYEPLKSEIEKLDLNIKGIVEVLSKDTIIRIPGPADDVIIPARGLDELVQKTADELPDLQKLAFINQQRVDNELKLEKAVENKEKAKKIIATSVSAAFAEGFVPIPLADSAMMIPTQMAMIAGITAVYGIDLSKNIVKTLAIGFASAEAAAFTGKMVFSNTLKLIPVVGTVAGGAISGGTGAAITGAVGLAYVGVIETMQENGMSNEEFEVYIKDFDFKDALSKVNQDDIDKIKEQSKDVKGEK